MLIAPFNKLEETERIISENREELGAVILEPVQRILPPAPGFLEGLREITARYDIPLIFDEVVTGFRLAYGGAQERFGVQPDLAAIGKVVGGGYPLAAVCGRADIMRHYDASQSQGEEFIPQIGTLNGNPIAAVAGLATLAELRKPGTYERLRATGHRLRTALEEAMRQAEVPAQVVGDDTVFDVYFTDQEISDYRSTLAASADTMKRFNRLLLDEWRGEGGAEVLHSTCPWRTRRRTSRPPSRHSGTLRSSSGVDNKSGVPDTGDTASSVRALSLSPFLRRQESRN